MRIVVALLLLSVAPRVSSAGTILFSTSDESRTSYGDWGAQHEGLASFHGVYSIMD